MNADGVASYDDKVAHIDVVAQRGAAARAQAEQAGQKSLGRLTARKVFRAMSATKRPEFSSDGVAYVLADTPADRTDERLSKAWANHVRRVFIASFAASEPRPEPPRG